MQQNIKIKHTLNIHGNAASKELLSHIIKNLQAKYNIYWNGALGIVPINKKDQPQVGNWLI